MEAHTRHLTLTVLAVMPALVAIGVVQAHADHEAQIAHVTVKSVDLSGKPIDGYYTEIYSGSHQINSGYTPYVFSIRENKTYVVHVEDWGRYGFGHWQDTNSTNATRQVYTSSDITLVAVYDTVPGQPTDLQANATNSTTIFLKWTKPSSDGGSPITGYRVSKSTDGHTWSGKNTRSTATTFVDSGLTSDTKYYYRVHAVNAIGTGPASNKTTAMTPVQTVTINGTAIGNITLAQPSMP